MTLDLLTAFLPLGGEQRKTIEISGKPLAVASTRRAWRALARRHQPLVVEMELAFACFARKTVRFHEQLPGCNLTYVTDKLAVYAHAVIPDHCETSQAASGSRVEAGRFAPKRLWIDFKKGRWTGEYGL